MSGFPIPIFQKISASSMMSADREFLKEWEKSKNPVQKTVKKKDVISAILAIDSVNPMFWKHHWTEFQRGPRGGCHRLYAYDVREQIVHVWCCGWRRWGKPSSLFKSGNGLWMCPIPVTDPCRCSKKLSEGLNYPVYRDILRRTPINKVNCTST